MTGDGSLDGGRGSPIGQFRPARSETPSDEASPGGAIPTEEPLVGVLNAGAVVRVGDPSFEAVVVGYGMSPLQIASLPSAAAAVLEDTAGFLGSRAKPGVAENLRWRAHWFREHADRLIAG